MRTLTVVALLAVVGCAAATSETVDAKILPQEFYGKYDLDHSENFDEYLKAKGYGWFTRQLVTFATFKKEFTQNKENKKIFDYANLTSKKDVFYKNVELGKSFVGEGLDGTKHEVTFDVINGVLYEKHHPIEGGEAKDETYAYSFEGDFLLVKMEADGVIGKRFYKRTA